MKHINEKCILPYNIQDIFDLVIDIESYTEFLPWISGATILSKEKSTIIADLIVNFGGFKHSYRSNVIYALSEEEAYIEAESHTGPFKHLKTRWDLRADPLTASTLINFTLEFELNSKLMTNLVSSVIIKTQKQMIDAFANRAKEKYEKKA